MTMQNFYEFFFLFKLAGKPKSDLATVICTHYILVSKHANSENCLISSGTAALFVSRKRFSSLSTAPTKVVVVGVVVAIISKPNIS